MTEPSQSSEPMFPALARIIANGILAGAYPPSGQVPSTTELAASYVDPFIEESRLLGIPIADVIAMIRERDTATPQRRPTHPKHPITGGASTR